MDHGKLFIKILGHVDFYEQSWLDRLGRVILNPQENIVGSPQQKMLSQKDKKYIKIHGFNWIPQKKKNFLKTHAFH